MLRFILRRRLATTALTTMAVLGTVATTTALACWNPPPPTPHLVIIKTADHKSAVSAGDQIGFTVEVENTGDASATGVSLNDTLPTGSGSGVTWAIASDPHNAFQLGTSAGKQKLELKSSTLSKGADYTVHITAMTSVTECSVYDNSATLTAGNASSAGPATAKETCQKPSVSVTKTADKSPVNAGDAIGFTIKVSNAGPGTATNVGLSDPLPSGTASSWVIASQTNSGQCSIGSGTLSCSGVSLGSGASFSVHITSTTNLADCATYPNTVTVSSSNAGSPSASASIVCQKPSVSVTKTADKSPVNAGDAIGFTIKVSNAGPGTATNVGLSDPLPSGTASSWVIASQTNSGQCSIGSGTLSCSGVSLGSGASFSVHITSTTNLADCATYPNTVTVSSSNAGSPSASASIVCQKPSVSVTKTADKSPVNAGDAIGFTIKVSNAGPGTATNVGLSDPLPSGTASSWVIASQTNSGQCSIGSGTLSCSGVSLGSGASFSVHITSTTNLADCATYPNTVTVSSSNAGSPSASASIVCQKPSPAIVTTQEPASGTIGEVFKDSATLSGGVNLAGSGSITFKLYSASDCGGDVLDSETVDHISANGAFETPTGVTLQNAGDYYWVASFSGDSNNPSATSGCNDEKVAVAPNQSAIVTTQEPASGAIGDVFKDSANLSGAVNPVGSITFKLYSAKDCGGSVLDTETLSVDGNGTYTTPDGFEIPNSGAYYWVASFSGDSNNLPAASGCNDEPVSVSQNVAGVATTLSSSAGNVGVDVHDSAKLSNVTADATGTVTYAVYGDNECTQKVADGGTVNVTNGSVPNSNDVTFNTPGTYYWQASYSGDANNTAAVSKCTDEQLVVAPLIDLAVTKVGSPNPITLGSGNITWTMVVTNNGPDTATAVTISDPLPVGNTFVSVSTTQGTCTGGAIIGCNLGTMAFGATVTITLVTTPTVAGTVTNTVTVVGNETETNTANNTASASVVVVGPHTPPVVYCVAVSKLTPHQLFVGRKTTLTIHLTRHGNAVKGVRVLITGPKLHLRTAPSNSSGVIKQKVKPAKAGIVVFTPLASSHCGTKRLGVTGVFTPPVTG